MFDMIRKTREGVALQLDAGDILASRAAMLRVQEQLFDLLAQRLSIAVTVSGLHGDRRPEVVFVKLCKVLQKALMESGAPASAVSLVLDAADLPPQFARMVRCAILGEGLVYLLVGRELSRPAAEPGWRRRQDRFWLQSWHLRNCQFVQTAFAPSVTSPCPLFAAESATGILPTHGLQIPPGTAWVVSRVNLSDYIDSNGELDDVALRKRLHHCVATGDGQHDDTEWPTATMRHDSWSNRRLAVSITGIGDFAKAQGMDPRSLIALQELETVVQMIRNTVNASSRDMAAAKEYAPALQIAEDGAAVAGAAWKNRWQAALQFAATRHRNLLNISPWSVFPTGEPANVRYCDLLPILAYADTCAFAGTPCLRSWNVNEFKYLHQRAGAILEQKDAQQMIAEQV